MRQFYQPGSVKEALDLLWELREQATIIAGGTDVTLDIKRGAIGPAALVNIRNLKEFSYIKVKEGIARIGATTTLEELVCGLPGDAVSVRQAAGYVGNRQIRNMATVGGNLCRASSVGDLGVAFLSLDGDVRLMSKDGERSCPLGEFFLGKRRVDRKPEELLAEVSFRLPAKMHGEAYRKFYSTTRKSIPLVNIAVNVSFDEGGKVRAAAGGVSDRPVRLRRFEKQFNESNGLDDLGVALEEVQRDIEPIDDRYSSAEYKKSLCATLVGRSVADIYRDMGGRDMGGLR